jgi:SWI/SNF-related matrix-associated actin-dependent regulator of chromatin subfamily A containing DEAD/H box 1
MDSFGESPAKRQKLTEDPIDLTSDGESEPYSPPGGTPPYETIATLPLHPHDNNRLTQPTQIIDRNDRNERNLSSSPTSGVVQVAASSPAPTPVKRPGGFLSSAMAPAGTVFRKPNGVVKGPSQPAKTVIDLSDDDAGPRYMGGSSDEDESQIRRKNDIKPTKFIRRDEERVAESPQAKQPTKDIRSVTAGAYYNPASSGKSQGLQGSVYDSRNRNGTSTSTFVTSGGSAKSPSDAMSAAYGNIRKPPLNIGGQAGPSRALPVQQPDSDMSLSDIDNPQERRKVERMRGVLHNNSIRECHRALLVKHGNSDDAVDYLSELNERRDNTRTPGQGKIVDLTSEDELRPTPAAPKMRQEIKAPAKSMWEKFGGSTQTAKAPPPSTSQESRLIPKIPGQPAKRMRKLVRGPRPRSSSPAEPKPRSQPPIRKTAKVADSSDSDEAAAAESASEDENLEARLLSYFNKCSPADLADIAAITPEDATYVLSRRPFKSLNAVRSVPAQNAKPTKAKSRARPIGEKIVDKCGDMLNGYEAVDSLVKQCEEAGKPLAVEMKTWGVDLFGAKEGELDLVTLKASQANHDSGIGTPLSDLSEDTPEKKRRTNFISQPTIMSNDRRMKDYQVVGINWLNLLFKNKLSGILADDMGLGKTCQVIAFLAHLSEIGERGPHLVIVPSSTLENWLTEFQSFCPSLVVRPLYGTLAERFVIRDQIDQDRANINVVITTYTTARQKDDFPWLRAFGFCCAIYDEGHFLRNSTSQLYERFIKITAQMRLLLTGTPLQNNLQELISLLAFLMPKIFKDKKSELQVIFDHKVKTSDTNHEALLSAQRIDRARSMLTPFILRRKKHQVLKDLPNKISRVEYCSMTEVQQSIYSEQQERAADVMQRRAAGEQMSAKDSANILMKLRQAAIHPFLFRRIYTEKTLRQISKACLKDDQWAQSNPNLIYQELTAYSDMEIHQLCAKSDALNKFMLRNDEWMISGKVEKLVELLKRFTAEGHRILIFSQFVMVMDILELVLQTIHMEFFRLDGMTKVEERQDMINEFCDPESTIPVFMLSTRAGGAGINLAKANKVIIFDSGFNPQDDIQAENRAHRIGQEKEVEVVRLVTKGTIEEQIHIMGQMKVKLDERVAGDEDVESKKESEKREAEGQKMVEELLFKKLEGNDKGDNNEGEVDETKKQENAEGAVR